MKPKLVLIVLALVVLPTAWLSFMASRALRNREDLLQYRLKMDAASAIQVVSRRIQMRFEDDIEHVRSVMSECIARGGKNADIEATASRLRNSRGNISQLYLFMNPWGFIFPEPSGREEPAKAGLESPVNADKHKSSSVGSDNQPSGLKTQFSSSRPMESLVAALRREIALIGARTNALSLTVEDASYWFSCLPERKDLYAGFEINQTEFMEELSSALKIVSGETFALMAEGPGIGGANSVLVSDVFGGITEVRDKRPDLSEEPVAVGRLMKPFDYISIRAFIVDSGKIKRAAALRYRLETWGIILMAVGILAGLLLVLREAAEEIKRARTRSDFVIGVSHDLRTPVASMRMLAESLYLDHVESPEQQKKFLRVIVRESERLGQLIERVLFFVRMDQKSLVYRFRDIDIGKLVAVTVEAFKTKAAVMDQKAEIRVHHLSIGSAIEPGLPSVKADESAVSQVILNLLDNALKYSRKEMEDRSPHSSAGLKDEKVAGGAEDERSSGSLLSVAGNQKNISRVPLPESAERGQATYHTGVNFAMWARAERRGTAEQPSIFATVSSVETAFRHIGILPSKRWVKISIKDKGVGIEKKELRKIFRQFYRVRKAADSNISGVGLGLALCRHVAEAHGGWIEVESEHGKGSTFSVYLPAGKE
ncbi:MAG: hypothetical protein A2283_23075 [Lentisphaerae bacterium RIFOXYA12_FULL_48_11]|nr:MAG: hypothetical protein A2283_23075 [Lentisphaerae bacterium RIFOXYA12_FULL_48_11]